MSFEKFPTNPPAIMRKSEFARMLGITPGALTQAISSGSVSVTIDKKINTRHRKNIRYALECRARKEKLAKGQSEERKKSGFQRVDQGGQKPKNGLDDSEGEDVNDAAEQFKADYQIAKLVAQTKQVQIKNATLLKMLIDRKFVDAVIGRIASVLSNHLLTMGDRVAADCAAACGALTPENKILIKQILDKDTTRSINALKLEIQREYESKVEG